MKFGWLYITFLCLISLASSEASAIEAVSCASHKAQKRFHCNHNKNSNDCTKSGNRVLRCKERRAVQAHRALMQMLPEVVCATVYQPVCATTCGGGTSSFSSSCEAALFGATVLHEGMCEFACATIFNPVCAINYYGSLETYPSQCEALISGASVIHRASCLRKN